MNFFALILFYIISSSIIFVYGIGLERLYIFSKNPKGKFIFLLKNFILQIIAITILWFFNEFVLAKINTSFLLPIFITLVLFLLNEIFKLVFPKLSVSKDQGFVFYYAPIFLALFIASSYIETLAIIITANFGFLIFSCILNFIKQKTDEGNANKYWKQSPLLLISMGLILTALYFIDIIV